MQRGLLQMIGWLVTDGVREELNVTSPLKSNGSKPRCAN